MVSSMDVIAIASVISLGLLIILWIRQRNKPLENEFRIIVFTEERSIKATKKTEESEHSFSLDETDYPCKPEDAWIIPLGFGDKLFRRIKNRYLFLFRKPSKTPKAKDIPQPMIIKRAEIPVNSCLILWKVKKYRGVKEGIEDQFKEPAQFNIPSWALIVVVIAMLILGVILLDQMGYFSPDEAVKAAKVLMN